MSQDQVVHLLQKKRDFFESILEISEGEHALPIPDWIACLEQKKVLLSCIDEVDEKLTPFNRTLHNLSSEINEELEKIGHVVERILHLDRCNQEMRRAEIRPYDPT